AGLVDPDVGELAALFVHSAVDEHGAEPTACVAGVPAACQRLSAARPCAERGCGTLPIIGRMVRSSQLLHPAYEPAAPRAAATLLLLRDSFEGIEVLMTRRSHTASFAPGAYVFPGGRIDEGDIAARSIARRRRH